MEMPNGLGAVDLVLQDSTHEPYKIMYNYMKAHADEVLMENNEDGVWKVQHENYAYLMESSSIEYIRHRKCNVTQIGGLLDSKSYGIAMKKGRWLNCNVHSSNNWDKLFYYCQLLSIWRTLRKFAISDLTKRLCKVI